MNQNPTFRKEKSQMLLIHYEPANPYKLETCGEMLFHYLTYQIKKIS